MQVFLQSCTLHKLRVTITDYRPIMHDVSDWLLFEFSYVVPCFVSGWSSAGRVPLLFEAPFPTSSDKLEGAGERAECCTAARAGDRLDHRVEGLE